MSEHSPEVEKVVQMIPYMRQLFGEEMSFAVSDTEKCVFSENGKHLKIPLHPGDSIKSTTHKSAHEIAMETRQRVTEKVPKEAVGVAFQSIAVPILEDGRVVGGLGVAIPVEIEDKLQGMAQKMNSAVESVSGGASGFAASAQELAATSSELAGNTDRIRHDVKDMDTIISLIMEIASQTHLLGLNAAIEAARAGDMGRGFNVVAEEIRKLAGRTQTSAKEVTEKLNRIKNNIDALAEHVLQVSSVSEEQAATSQEISAGIQELEPIAKELISVAAELVK